MRRLPKCKKVYRKTKIRVCKTVIRATLTYACETWIMPNKIRQRIENWERKILRSIFGEKTELG